MDHSKSPLKERDANKRSAAASGASPPMEFIDLTAPDSSKENHSPNKGKAINKSTTKSKGPTTATATTTATTKATANPKKRKSDAAEDDVKNVMFPADAPEIDDDDPRLIITKQDTCEKTRRKIRDWIGSGAQKVGEFQREIDVSSRGYSNFMNRSGTWDGRGCETYIKALAFFKRRELAGLPLKVPNAKKPKTAVSGAGGARGTARRGGKTDEELLDTGGGDIVLPREEEGRTPVYMTCDEVRRSMRALIAKGISQAALARALSGMFPADSGKVVSTSSLR